MFCLSQNAIMNLTLQY